MKSRSYILIKENDDLINKFTEEFQTTITNLGMNGYKMFPVLKPNGEIEQGVYMYSQEEGNERAVDYYKVEFQRQFYEQIVKTIDVVGKEPLSLFEKPRLTEQLSTLSEIFFHDLDSQNDADTYWQMTETERSRFDDGVTYPNPKELTREFVEDYISYLNPKPVNSDSPAEQSWVECENEAWFRVAVEYVEGRVDELKKRDDKWTDIAEKLFPDIPDDKKCEFGYTRSNLRVLLSQSYNNGGRKSVFKRKKKDLRKIIAYCDFNNLEITNTSLKAVIEADYLNLD